MSRTQALLLNAEIAAVLSSMRQSAKWALVPRQYTYQDDDDLGDDPLLDDFRDLRRRIFRWRDWSAVRPLDYMQPFLEVVRSSEISGTIKGVALTSIRRILDLDIIGIACAGVAEAMCATADSITQCKFEATDPASDEVVLYKILQVLSSCVTCAAGHHLSDGNVLDIFHACFRLGHYQTERTKDMSELLTQAARQIMLGLGTTIFSRLESIVPQETPSGGSPTERHLATSRLHSPTAADLGDLAAEGVSIQGKGNGIVEAIGNRLTGNSKEEPAVLAAVSGNANGPEATSAVSGGGLVVPASDAAGTKAAARDWGGEQHTVSVAGPSGATSPKASHLQSATLSGPLDTDAVERPNTDGDGASGHGLPAAADILVAIVSYVNSSSEGLHSDLNEFGLELLCAVLNAGGSAFELHADLMDVIQTDLFAALSVAACEPSLACLSGACQVALSLYCHLGQHLLLQLEVFISAVLLQLVDGKGTVRIEQQEAALEGVLDLCNQPSFVRNVYTNMDCRIERSNLFATTAVLLSKTATPAPSAPLGSVNLLSLEGLVAIVSALADSCHGPSSGWDPAVDFVVPPVDTPELKTVWGALASGKVVETPELYGSLGGSSDGNGNNCVVSAARQEKAVKQRLVVAAEHFNRDHRKGLQYLQAMGLLDKDLDPTAVAQILRRCPGLSKFTIGELLGEQSEFWVSVLSSFVTTFDFSGLDFDTSLRMLLQSFRLPGESQKISRILEHFAARYYEQCNGTFANADAAYILSYSVIMLNTDQHNKQVKQKMTLEQFIRNNRGINAQRDLPDEFLHQIYDSIRRNEIKLKEGDESSVEVAPVVWTELQRASLLPRGIMINCPLSGCSRLERDMLTVVWAPTLAAVSVVLGRASDQAVVGGALSCLMRAASVAAYHGMDEELDSLLASLSDYTSVLEPASPKAVAAFGESDKSRGALQAVFQVANTYGGSLREMGWRAILTWIVRLGVLGLLPEGLLWHPSERMEDAKARLPKPVTPSRTSSSGSMLSRAFNTFIGDSSQDVNNEMSERESAAWTDARGAVSAAGVSVPFSAASAQLPAASLQALVASTVWGAETATGSGGSESAELCLELLFTLAVRNAERVHLMWQPVHDALAEVLSPQASAATGDLVSRAVSGLLRIAPMLIGRSQAATSGVLRSLQLLLRLHPDIAWDLAEPMAAQMLRLVQAAGPAALTVGGWRILCALITNTSARPEACGTALAALREVASPESLSLTSYQPCLTAVQAFVNSQAKKDPYPNVSLQALDILEVMCRWLVSSGEAAVKAAEEAAPSNHSDVRQSATTMPSTQATPLQPAGSGALRASAGSQAGASRDSPPTLESAWLLTMAAIVAVCTESNIHIRCRACVILTGMVTSSDGMRLSGSTWVTGLNDLLLPLVPCLNTRLLARARDFPDAAKTMVAAISAVSKGLLISLPRTAPLPAFPELWLRLLTILRECIDSRSDDLAEHVPEALKNMLNVMSASHVLVPGWQDAQGNSMWDATWARAREVSSGLGPQMLQHTEPHVRLQQLSSEQPRPQGQGPQQEARAYQRQQSPLQGGPQHQHPQSRSPRRDSALPGSPQPRAPPGPNSQQQQQYPQQSASPQVQHLQDHQRQQQQRREAHREGADDTAQLPVQGDLSQSPVGAASVIPMAAEESQRQPARHQLEGTTGLRAVMAKAHEYLLENRGSLGSGRSDDDDDHNNEDSVPLHGQHAQRSVSNEQPEGVARPSPSDQSTMQYGRGSFPLDMPSMYSLESDYVMPAGNTELADTDRMSNSPAAGNASLVGRGTVSPAEGSPQQQRQQSRSPQQQQQQQPPVREAPGSPDEADEIVQRPGWMNLF